MIWLVSVGASFFSLLGCFRLGTFAGLHFSHGTTSFSLGLLIRKSIFEGYRLTLIGARTTLETVPSWFVGRVRDRNICDFCACYLTKGLNHLGLMLSRLALKIQAAVLDSQFFDLLSPFDDDGMVPKVGTGWRNVANALVVPIVIVMIDKCAGLVFEIAGCKALIMLFEEPVL